MKLPSTQEQYYILGYAMALQDVLEKITGENNCAKRYDPITFESDYILSYAFDLKTGGRKHPLSDFQDIDDIANTMLEEVVLELREEISSRELSEEDRQTIIRLFENPLEPTDALRKAKEWFEKYTS